MAVIDFSDNISRSNLGFSIENFITAKESYVQDYRKLPVLGIPFDLIDDAANAVMPMIETMHNKLDSLLDMDTYLTKEQQAMFPEGVLSLLTNTAINGLLGDKNDALKMLLMECGYIYDTGDISVDGYLKSLKAYLYGTLYMLKQMILGGQCSAVNILYTGMMSAVKNNTGVYVYTEDRPNGIAGVDYTEHYVNDDGHIFRYYDDSDVDHTIPLKEKDVTNIFAMAIPAILHDDDLTPNIETLKGSMSLYDKLYKRDDIVVSKPPNISVVVNKYASNIVIPINTIDEATTVIRDSLSVVNGVMVGEPSELINKDQYGRKNCNTTPIEIYSLYKNGYVVGENKQLTIVKGKGAPMKKALLGREIRDTNGGLVGYDAKTINTGDYIDYDMINLIINGDR